MQQSEQAFLRSVFLMEAWDTVGAMEGALTALTREERPAVDTDHPLLMLAHKLRGAAAVQGLTDVSGLAAAIQDRVTRVLVEAPRNVGQGLGDVGQLIDAIKHGLDDIGRATAVSDAGDGWDAGDRASADILDYFAPEAAEHLETMTRSLLALEQEPSEAEVATLFRAVHTLKGAALTVGCRSVGDLAHRIEDLMMAVRDGVVPLGPAVIEAVFAGTDALRLLIASAETDPQRLASSRQQAEEALGRFLPATPAPAEEPTALDGPPRLPLALPDEPYDVVPRLPTTPVPLPPPEARHPPRRASIRVVVERLDALMAVVGELVIARRGLEARLSQLDRVAELLLASRTRMLRVIGEFERKYAYTPLPVASAGGSQAPAAATAPGSPEPIFSELELDRYDDFNILARSLGEISADVSEGRTQLASAVRNVRDDAAQLRRLTTELRSDITRARMVPIGSLFARFARPVREASKMAGRQVVLRTSGESAELDNAIIEQIADPLLHLVQNAIWHGIEPPEERQVAGKPAQGTVQLSARSQGSFILIEVEDDGRGIDVPLLTACAIGRGILRPEVAATLTPADAIDLIFVPGLSTADSVSLGAGRGVGMDVVRTNVSRLNGEIAVETEVGVGTRFTLKLPLTVVISDALLVRVGSETLAVPLPAIRRIVALGPGEVERVGGAEMVEVEGEWLDLVRLDVGLGLTGRPVGRKLSALVLRAGGRSLAVAVDELLRREEIVIKGLGEFLDDIGPFSGTAIGADGRLMLVLDPSRLRRMPEDVVHVAPARPREVVSSRGVVLLVDDSVSVRKFVGSMLTRAGFTVHTAVDGADALEQLRALAVDVLVTDLELPRLNGYELIEAVGRLPATRGVPVVVLTTRAGDKHVTAARRLGVRHYVTKPVNEPAFLRLIESLAQSARMPAAPGNGHR